MAFAVGIQVGYVALDRLYLPQMMRPRIRYGWVDIKTNVDKSMDS